MKHPRAIFIVLLLGLLTLGVQANNRFYPANSIRCTNVSEIKTNEYDPINHKYKVKRTYYHYYTGNDTIVDGSPCVMLWKYSSEAPKEKELRFIREVEGVVSCKYPLAEGGYSDWVIMFEFPYGGWIEGEMYIDGLINGEPAIFPAYPITYTLLNGENIQLNFNSLMYGIGYNDWPFLEIRNFGETSDMRPYNYYRNDTLLWGEQTLKRERFFPANSIRCTNMETSMYSNDTIYYNLYTGSDTIVDGKECVQLWKYYTDTPESLEQYLLLEEADKVYIKYSTSEDHEWQLLYDFSLPIWHVGDSISIEDARLGRLPIESIDTITLLNGITRQVANLPMGGKLIYGMGCVGEPFFEPIFRLRPTDGTVHHPVSFYYWNELLWGKEIPKKREQRFFPANGVHTTNVYHGPRYSEDFEIIEARDTIYYNKWTGNDTIVDGRECVVVWSNRGGVAKRYGVIYESLNGLVYFNYASDEPYSPNYWLCLYDFTPRKWKVGDMICTNYDGTMEQYEKVEEVSSIILQNGEEVPFIDIDCTSIIYGIGYNSHEPFLSPREAYNGYSGKSYPVNFYRNGELLWGEELKPEIPQSNRPYLITEGLQWAKCYNYYPGNYRSVAYELRGDTIIDGKSYKKEWSTDWEDLSHMELTGNFMREEAGKVYRKSKNSNEYLWFDYEANIGDTIFYDDCFVKVIGHSDTTIVCNGVSRTYKGVDVQVGSISGSNTDYEYSLVPGYVETFYEDLGLFRNGDVVSDPSFLTTGGWIELLWLKRDGTMLYQQEDGVLWKDNTGIEVPKSEQADIYYDLQGRPVAHPTRGVYIKDRKKVAIK